MSHLNDLVSDAESHLGASEEFSRHEYAKFIEHGKAELAANRRDNAQVLQWCAEAFMFHAKPFDDKRNESYFGPMATLGDDEHPAWSKMDDAAIDLYATRASVTENVFARMRYADIVWEKRRDHKFARIAHADYLEVSQIYSDRKWLRQASEVLARALTLATHLSDRDLVGASIAAIRNFVERCQQQATFEDMELIKRLTRLPKKYAADELLEWANDRAIAGADHFAREGGEHLWTERGYLDVAAKIARRRGLSDVDVRRRTALSLKRHGLERGGLVGSSFLREAIAAFQVLGDRQETAALLMQYHEMAKRSEKEFGVVESEIKIPTEDVERYIASFIIPEDLVQSLRLVAVHFQPDIESARQQAVELKQRHPLLYLIPNQTVSHDGRVVGQATTEEEIFEHQVMGLVRLGYQMSATFISRIFAQLAQHGLDAKALTEFLCASDVIGGERDKFIEHAVERYFERDWVSTIHVLAPQIERILRSMLATLGGGTTRQDEYGQQRVLHLDAVLRTEKMRATLGENLWTYFCAVLVDEDAENTRHYVAHGLIPWEQCNETRATLLVHLLMTLTMFKKESRASNERAG